MADWTLAIDTSTYTQIICLMEGDRVRAHTQQEPPGNHGSMLLSAIDLLLTQHEITTKDLALIAIGVGPGSFTGLRVGLACAKGLALATGCPIVGVSTLQAMALPFAMSQPGKLITAAVDARKKEVYSGSYTWDNASQSLQVTHKEQALAPAALHDLMVTHHTSAFVGFMTSKYKPLRPSEDDPYTTLDSNFTAPSGVALATLGKLRFASLQESELATLEPNYIRPSDAEVSLQKRLAKENA